MQREPRPAASLRSSAETSEVTAIRFGTLDRWLNHPWEAGVQVDQLDDLAAVRVETRNSTYDLAIVCARTGEILVRGGRYFPEWTRVQFVGCSLGGGLLKRYGVHVGFSMEFYEAGRLIITSPIRAILVAPEPRTDLACAPEDKAPTANPPAGP